MGYLTMQQMHGVVYIIYIEFVNVHYPSYLGCACNDFSVALLLLPSSSFHYVRHQANEVVQNLASFSLIHRNYFSLLVFNIFVFRCNLLIIIF